MCLFLNLLVLFIFFISYLVNFLITYSYRQRLANCILKKSEILRNLFVVHPLELYFFSI